MPRRKATEAASEITPSQAHYILGKLLEDRRITVGELNGYVKRMESEIRDLEARLSALRSSYSGASATNARSRRSETPDAKPAGSRKGRAKRKAASEEQRASRQLQGQYMSLIRRFPAERREAFKKLSDESGRQAAIDRMRSELAS